MTSRDQDAGLDPTRCTARRKSGGQCRAKPVRGATVCRMHGGSAPQVRAAAARRVALQEVERVAARLGGMIDVDPLDVLLESVHEAAANVAALRLAVEELGIQVADQAAVAVPSSFDTRGKRDPALTHILVVMYNDERDRLARYAKLCLDAGVDERRVRLVEAQARVLGEVVEAAVRSLDPSPDQYRVAVQAAAKAMRQLAAQTPDAA